MKIFAITFICLGTISILLGLSNKTKKSSKGEKTTTGTVESFGLLNNNKFFATKYRAIVKVGNKKYTIDAYSMPWLNKKEEVLIQMTGKQKVLGNERLNNRSKLELFIGINLFFYK